MFGRIAAVGLGVTAIFSAALLERSSANNGKFQFKMPSMDDFMPASFCESHKTKNQAFVFIKPHANTKAAQALVVQTLKAKGISIKSEGELSAKQIDEGMLIDQVRVNVEVFTKRIWPKERIGSK